MGIKPVATVTRVPQAADYDQMEQEKAKRYAKQRNLDLKAGRDRGQEIFGNQALGRLDTSRSSDVADILARRKEQLGGYTPEEQQAMREQNMAAIVNTQKAGSRDLARQQARSGVRGALASNQQAQYQLGTQGQLADQERQLFLNNIAAKRDALSGYEQSVGGAEKGELERQQFNLGQGEKELQGKLSTEFGYGGLGAQERSAAMQSILGDKAIKSSKDIAAITKGKK